LLWADPSDAAADLIMLAPSSHPLVRRDGRLEFHPRLVFNFWQLAYRIEQLLERSGNFDGEGGCLARGAQRWVAAYVRRQAQGKADPHPSDLLGSSLRGIARA
jgi:hypothetical protein